MMLVIFLMHVGVNKGQHAIERHRRVEGYAHWVYESTLHITIMATTKMRSLDRLGLSEVLGK